MTMRNMVLMLYFRGSFEHTRGEDGSEENTKELWGSILTDIEEAIRSIGILDCIQVLT